MPIAHGVTIQKEMGRIATMIPTMTITLMVYKKTKRYVSKNNPLIYIL